MGRGGDEKKRVNATATVIMTVAVGAAMTYLGVRLSLFGVYAFSEGELLLGGATLVVGVLFVAGPVAVVVSQVRALLRHRRGGS